LKMVPRAIAEGLTAGRSGRCQRAGSDEVVKVVIGAQSLLISSRHLESSDFRVGVCMSGHDIKQLEVAPPCNAMAQPSNRA
jgi:hypothetical protein